MSDIIDAIAAALNGRGNYPLGSDLRPEAERVLAALRERYAIVPRPEPPIGGYEHIVESGKKRYAVVELPNSEGDFCWSIEDVGDIMVGDRGGVVLASGDPVLVMAADEARKFAAALLAAADKAEEGK